MRKINRPLCPNARVLRTNYKHPDNKEALIHASHGKCMYCESKITHVYFGDVEHIKPKAHYPQHEFDWSNLGFVCAKCNGAKGDKYDEATPYINPYDEHPDQHLIALGSLLKHRNGSERGELTIADIDLNRADLIEKRQTRIDELQKAIDACMRTRNSNLRHIALNELLKDVHSDKEYSFIAETLFKLHGLNNIANIQSNNEQ